VSETKPGFAYFKQVAIGAASGLMAVVLMVGLFSLGGAPTANPSDSASATPTGSSTPSASPSNARTCSVATQVADKRLGTFSGVVINPATKEVLFDRNANVPGATASVLKLFTAAAALTTLGPNYVVDTKVFADPDNPGTIILVGGGDPTLSATPQGKQSVYKNAPKLSDLAIKVNAWATANNIKITNIILDSTLFAGGTEASKWDPSWPASELTLGYQSQITALQVDGDRAQSYVATSPRSKTPVMNVGRKFKAALGTSAKGSKIVEGIKPAAAIEVAKVTSQTIDKWIKYMLLVSDNTQAEYLARLVSLKLGYDGSLGSIQMAIKKSLASTNIDLSTVVIKDGSGESPNNAIAPATVAALLDLVLDGYGDFDVINQGLPISHESGSLATRYGGDNLDAAGKIRAKTGWIDKGYTLAGIIQAKDGTNLLFAVYALGDVKADAKDAIDNLVTGFYRCGNKLSNE
jgi:D-alanyl-D-alanine carboxypeptidase/D-alanyl-D-alanine-endopeptidase (penicillin-binding protein 4)